MLEVDAAARRPVDVAAVIAAAELVLEVDAAGGAAALRGDLVDVAAAASPAAEPAAPR